MKRLFDVIGSLFILSVLSPLLFVLAIVIRYKLGEGVLFRQRRPGLNGHVFEMIKFRSMTDELDQNGNVLPDSERLTHFGNMLRKSSLDEIPGLWCVLKGDMSLVGPRPLLLEYLPLYNQEQARRHNVRPGITGWAQVNGRNTISWEKKFELDVWYVDNYSFWLDIKILFLTVKKVLISEDINFSNEQTEDYFKGTSDDKNSNE